MKSTPATAFLVTIQSLIDAGRQADADAATMILNQILPKLIAYPDRAVAQKQALNRIEDIGEALSFPNSGSLMIQLAVLNEAGLKLGLTDDQLLSAESRGRNTGETFVSACYETAGNLR